jgi:hypothetical protein
MGKPVGLFDTKTLMPVAGVGKGEYEGDFRLGHAVSIGLRRGLDSLSNMPSFKLLLKTQRDD